MKAFPALFFIVLLLSACSQPGPEEQQAIQAVQQYVRRTVDAPVKDVHAEAHGGHQEDAEGRNRSGYTVEYTFEMETAPGKQEEITAVYFADSAGNVMPSTK